MLLRSMLVAVLVGFMGGCASLEPPGTAASAPPAPPDAFAHRVGTSHVVLYWNCVRPAADILRLEGIARNPWAAEEIRALGFDLVGVDGRERTVSEARGEARDPAIRTNQTTPFQLELRPAGGEVRYDLYYRYQFAEAEEMDALLAGPPVPLPRLFAEVMRSMARDVCSDTQHRAR